MSRVARIAIPGVPYHITQRGNGRRDIFYTDADHRTYLDLLARYAEAHWAAIWAYCLMSNHVHLIAVPSQPDSFAKAVGQAHAAYARYRNLIDRSCGHVWEARYFSCPLERAHLWRAVAYVERNPIRAGVASDAPAYEWSSARAHLGLGRPGLRLDTAAWAAEYDPSRWREVLETSVDEEAFQQRIREASKRGRPLGSEEFAERLEMVSGRSLRPKPPGRPKKQKPEMGILSRVSTASVPH